MKLSKVIAGIEGVLVSDGNFETIGFCASQINQEFLSFLESENSINEINENEKLTCVVCTPTLVKRLPKSIKGVFISDSPKYALFQIHNSLVEDKEYVRPHVKTVMGLNCVISDKAYIASEDVVIGNNVIVEEFVSIKGHVKIGDNCIIRAGSIIGGKGFSFARSCENEILGIEDCGSIELESYVEIFELVQISMSPFPWEKTLIKTGSKVDAQSLIGHGTTIGNGCLITEGSRICGNVKIEDNCWIGVGAIIKNRIAIGKNARVSIGSVVTKDVGDAKIVSGNFAIEHKRFLQFIKSIR